MRQQQEIKAFSNVTYILPAGEYRAVMESDTGIYFEAPGKVFMRENFLGLKLPDKPFNGGLYLERSAPQTALIYGITPENEGGEIQRMTQGGRPAKPVAPRQPVVFRLVR